MAAVPAINPNFPIFVQRPFEMAAQIRARAQSQRAATGR
jgi:hypothetical protein